LDRAAPLLRLPDAPDLAPEVLPAGAGLRSPASGRVYPYRGGVLDLLGEEVSLTPAQHTLDTPLTAWLYDRSRDLLLRLAGVPDFPTEVAWIQRVLSVVPGDSVLDLACGHGVVTVELAKRVGPDGLAIGVDISPAMLARAAGHTRRWGLPNILLVRGDAQRLPLAAGVLAKVNCSGGFHQFPDLPLALAEIARVSTAGAALTASTFAEGPHDRLAGFKRWLDRRFKLHFVPLGWLEERLAALGYTDFRWWMPGGWFAFTAARRRGPQAPPPC
jgi:SAM-dependent methyltransferase